MWNLEVGKHITRISSKHEQLNRCLLFTIIIFSETSPTLNHNTFYFMGRMSAILMIKESLFKVHGMQTTQRNLPCITLMLIQCLSWNKLRQVDFRFIMQFARIRVIAFLYLSVLDSYFARDRMVLISHMITLAVKTMKRCHWILEPLPLLYLTALKLVYITWFLVQVFYLIFVQFCLL